MQVSCVCDTHANQAICEYRILAHLRGNTLTLAVVDAGFEWIGGEARRRHDGAQAALVLDEQIWVRVVTAVHNTPRVPTNRIHNRISL